ncbi:MAG: hypothetical protein OXU61_10705 [Gammaproteobacteria bacterium]|nr:hypothetical protein [Gammaproteobacteria bacterium]
MGDPGAAAATGAGRLSGRGEQCLRQAGGSFAERKGGSPPCHSGATVCAKTLRASNE